MNENVGTSLGMGSVNWKIPFACFVYKEQNANCIHVEHDRSKDSVFTFFLEYFWGLFLSESGGGLELKLNPLNGYLI